MIGKIDLKFSKDVVGICFLGTSLFLAGVWQKGYVYGLVGALLLIGMLVWGRRGKISRQLFQYLVIILLMGLTLLWSKNMEMVFGNFVVFLLGGGWMYVGSLMGKEAGLEKKLVWMITFLGLGWLSIFLFQEVFIEGMRIGSRGLVWWGTHTKDHHHLGDWWALVVLSQLWLIQTGEKIKKRKNGYINLLLILVGVVWIYFSRSRSAILSVILGSLYMFKSKIGKEKLIRWVLLLSVLSFLFLGLSKPTFLNRQYWVQGVVGWWRYPFGLGMGNFGELSGDVRNHVFGLSNYSSVAHNVLLEFLVGMGVLGLSFWWWFIKYVIEPFVVGKRKPFLVGGLVLALGINFLFDYTYFISPMWWMFMFLMGKFIEKRD